MSATLYSDECFICFCNLFQWPMMANVNYVSLLRIQSLWKQIYQYCNDCIVGFHITTCFTTTLPPVASAPLTPTSCPHHSRLSTKPGVTEPFPKLLRPSGTLSPNTSAAAHICPSLNRSQNNLTHHYYCRILYYRLIKGVRAEVLYINAL